MTPALTTLPPVHLVARRTAAWDDLVANGSFRNLPPITGSACNTASVSIHSEFSRRNIMSSAVTSSTSIDVALSFFTAYNAHDLNKMLASLSEDAQLRYVPMDKQGEGKA